MKTKTLKFLGAVTAIVMSALGATLPASAGGFFGDIVNGVVPGAGTALDRLNDDIKGRSSDQSVYNHIMNLHWPDGRFEAARSAPVAPAPVLGNRCATQAGVYPGPFNPVGMTCGANTPWGLYYGTVIQ